MRTAHERVYGVRLLGSPIGTEQYQLTFCSKILEKIQTAAERVQNFPDSQTQWTFLNKVLKGKINHILRTVPTHITDNFGKSFDQMIDKTFEQIVHHKLTPSQWTQAELPIKDGGLGLLSTTSTVSAAYLASCSTSYKEVIYTNPEIRQDIISGKYDYQWSRNILEAA